MKIEVSTREQRNQFYNSSEWRTIRRQVLKRDHYECVWCRDEGKVTTTNLEVDHIKELEFYPEFALDLDNLRTLCKSCHNKRHNRFDKNDRNFRKDEWWG
ncbi:HNH endonuclease [Streptococcus mitis]|uniref:HNH endonuclease n=1 Tax=Streptococcus mitis TaxID=28037 RepID=UPI0039C47564